MKVIRQVTIPETPYPRQLKVKRWQVELFEIFFFFSGDCSLYVRIAIYDNVYCDPKRRAAFAAVTVRVFALQHLVIAQGEEQRRGEVAAR